jgi:hypothetical protein
MKPLIIPLSASITANSMIMVRGQPNAGDADACWRHSFVTSPKRMLRGNFSQ